MASKGKKDFTAANTGRVYDAIEQATAQTTPAEKRIPPRKRGIEPTQEEIDLAREQHKTQGRKGVRAVRFNMAFDPDIHEYITTMAKVRGQTVTQFTNYVFRLSMEQNKEVYEQAKAFQKLIK